MMGEGNIRGRPKLVMTRRRRQVLRHLADCVANGERITMGELVRRCGLYDRSSAKRILRDLRKMGQLAD
jgi:DNA-binding IclR family transcriptional regulator